MADSTPLLDPCSPCCCFLVLLIALSLLTSIFLVAFLVISLSLKPNLPAFSIDHLNLTKLSLSSSNRRSFLSHLDSSIDVSLKISNARNVTFIVDDMRVQVLYDDSLVSLGKGLLPGKFEVEDENVMLVDAKIGVKMKVIDQRRGNFVADRFKAKDLVLDMGWDLKVGGVWDGQLRKFPVKLLCNDLNMTRVLHGYNPKCSTHISPRILWQQ